MYNVYTHVHVIHMLHLLVCIIIDIVHRTGLETNHVSTLQSIKFGGQSVLRCLVLSMTLSTRKTLWDCASAAVRSRKTVSVYFCLSPLGPRVTPSF